MSWGGDIDDGGDGGGDDIASVVRAVRRRMGTFIERSLLPPQERVAMMPCLVFGCAAAYCMRVGL